MDTPPAQPQASEDERAIARYQYLLRTAPPERIEQVHAEAFAKLSPEQRQQVFDRLSSALPPGEAPRSDSPQAMATAATRAEMRQPGYMQGSFGGGGGMGGVLAGSLLGTIAGMVVGSAIAQSLFGGFEESPEAAAVGEGTGNTGDASAEGTAEPGAEGGETAEGTQAAEAGGDFFDPGGELGGFGDL